MPNNLHKGKKRIKGTFLLVPHVIFHSNSYPELSYSAAKMLFDIASQYNGQNNGNLAACKTLLEPLGWKSGTTIRKAVSELVHFGFIELTKQGGLGIGPNLYAITWQKIDQCLNKSGRPIHDAQPTKTPSNLWKLKPTHKEAA